MKKASNYILPEYAIKLAPEHPIRIYLDENEYIMGLLSEFAVQDPTKDFPTFFNLFNQVARVDLRYTRKENQLFPFLEKKGWLGPSHGMWNFHDQIRTQIRNIRTQIEKQSFDEIAGEVRYLISEIVRMIQVEENHLFPNALQILDEQDWQNVAIGEEEIGWMHNLMRTEYLQSNNASSNSNSFIDSFLKLSEGYMNQEQINLMLQALPFDLTFVDENDKVKFYNRGDVRVFPRSAGVIGREVRFCHPPKSVDTVLQILESFKSGKQNEAEFWINYRGRVIHIRYFAVRDCEQKYKGVIEVSQDITDIKNITGERRLLQWSDA